MSINLFVDKLLNKELPSTNNRSLDIYLKDYAEKCNACGLSTQTIKQDIKFQILFNKYWNDLIHKL